MQSWETLIDTAARLCGSQNELARHGRLAARLGVSPRTIRRWINGKAPRVASLSLWWLSRQGYSEWECEMERRAYYPAALARATLDDAIKAARQRVPVFTFHQNRTPAGLSGAPVAAMSATTDAEVTTTTHAATTTHETPRPRRPADRSPRSRRARSRISSRYQSRS